MFYDSASEEVREPNQDESAKLRQFENRVGMLKTELRCSQYIVATLEKTIQDKEDIICLLKKQSSSVQSFSGSGSVAGARKVTEKTDALVGNARQKLLNSAQQMMPQRKQPEVVVGSADPTSRLSGFSGALSRAWLYVGRVTKGTTEHQVGQYLKKILPGREFVVEALPVNDNANSVSFKVGPDISLLDELNKPENWPKDVVVRRYNFFRSRNKPSST